MSLSWLAKISIRVWNALIGYKILYRGLFSAHLPSPWAALTSRDMGRLHITLVCHLLTVINIPRWILFRPFKAFWFSLWFWSGENFIVPDLFFVLQILRFKGIFSSLVLFINKFSLPLCFFYSSTHLGRFLWSIRIHRWLNKHLMILMELLIIRICIIESWEVTRNLVTIVIDWHRWNHHWLMWAAYFAGIIWTLVEVSWILYWLVLGWWIELLS